jgi:hypothetical protein
MENLMASLFSIQSTVLSNVDKLRTPHQDKIINSMI